jgi:hypothetical protein
MPRKYILSTFTPHRFVDVDADVDTNVDVLRLDVRRPQSGCLGKALLPAEAEDEIPASAS